VIVLHVQILSFQPGLVLLGQQSSDQAQRRFVVREDADDTLAAADFLVEPLLHVGCP